MSRYSHSNPLGRRVLAAILICSTCLAILATGLQLFLDYRQGVSAVEVRLDEIEQVYADSVGASLWTMDEQQTRRQIEGISRLPGVMLVQLRDASGKFLMQAGELQLDSKTIRREISLRYSAPGPKAESQVLGTLDVTTSLEGVYRDLKDKALLILVTQSAKTALVVIFTLFIFRRLVSRHLSTIAEYARRLDLSNLGKTLSLSRKQRKQTDELDVVVSAFNDMAASIRRDVEELSVYRAGLERLVASRTVELAQKVAEKEEAIRDLNREIHERQQAEQSAREHEERYRQVVEMSPDAILIERDERIIFANRGTLALLGAPSPEQVKALPFLQMVPVEWRDRMQELSRAQLLARSRGEMLQPFEGKLVRFDGVVIDVEIRRAVFQYGGAPAVQTVIHDITHRKHYEEQLRRQALHDGLTGLPNRLLLMDRMEQAIAAAERDGKELYVLFFDLDRFKYVNDTLGHEAGDELLKAVAARMLDCARKSDTLARLGGDEFVLMLEGVSSEQAVAPLVKRLMERVSESILLGDQEVAISCSIGVSVYPQDAHDATTLLKFAETAMYQAKEKGRNGIEHYSADMHSRVNEHLVMESHLRHALERDEFRLHYQPLVDLQSGRIVGAEALVRWQHPDRGLVPPANFIPLAEETGLINGIGEWVLRTACAQAKAWHDAGFVELKISVNLSVQQLSRPYFDEEVANALRDSGLPPHCLELEITESASMRNPEGTVMLLRKLTAMGIGIAIDDFGTGYSNLSYLKRFPVERLKLDRSFVADITHNAGDSALARAIVSMARSLGLTVVAEGVEHAAQVRQLAGYGCDCIQGYYFSPPVAADAFIELLRTGRTLDVATDQPCELAPAG